MLATAPLRTLSPLLLLATLLPTPGAAQCPSSELVALDGQPADRFGQGVAANERTLLVGAPRAGAGAPGPGAVYVYARESHGWSEVEVLRPDPGEGGGFGRSVDVLRERAAVGAPTHPGGGAVYIYERPTDDWLLAQKLVGSDTAPGDQFGFDVAIFGAKLVVGAPGKEFFGAAYVFERQDGVWTETAKLTGPGIGHSVAVSENRVVVPSDALGVPSDALGHVFEPLAGSWVETQVFDLSGADRVRDCALSDDGSVVVFGGKNLGYAAIEVDGVWGEPEVVLPAPIFFYDTQVSVAVRDDGSGLYLGTVSTNVVEDNRITPLERVGEQWVASGGFQANAIGFGSNVAWAAGSIVGGTAKFADAKGKAFVFEDPFETYGEGVPGFVGIVPRIGFEGCPTASTSLSTYVVLGLGGAPGTFIVGLDKAQLPFNDITLWTSPVVLSLPFVLGGTAGAPAVGSVEVELAVPSQENFQGLAAHLQAVVMDPHAPNGLSSSAGYRVWIR